MSSLMYFEGIASAWNQMRSGYFEDAVLDLAVGESAKGKVVGDFGAGTGFLSLRLAQSAKTVFAVDQSRKMLSELKKSSHGAGFNNIVPIIGTFEAVPLFDESLDAAYSNMALHHVQSPAEAIAEIYRTLKPGGQLVITDVATHDGTWAHEEMHDVWLGFESQQLKQWFTEAGFTQVSVEHTGLYCQGTSSKGIFTRTGILMAKGIK